MSWQDRLQEYIVLTSPTTKTVFRCKWRGNEMSAEKRIGKFSYPLSIGTVVQDIGLSGFELPITIYFDGPDNDKESWAFLVACAEYGQWTVQHPVRGLLKLQLVSVTSHDNPVESGNITVIDTHWINPAALKVQTSTSETAASTSSKVGDINSSSQTLFSQINQAVDSIGAAYGAVTAGVNAVATFASNVTGTYLSAIAQAQSAMASLSNDLGTVAALVQTLTQIPGLLNGTVGQQVAAFQAIGTALGIVTPNGMNTQVPDYNTVSQAQGSELVLTALTGAIAGAIITTQPATRDDALSAINGVLDWYTYIINLCDGAGALFVNSNMVGSYIPFETTWPDLQELLSLMLQYLLSILFDLSTQITFTLKAERAPIAIAIDYYGQNGWPDDDSPLDFFIASNHLVGDQINLLPAGFEVQIFSGAA